MTEKLSPRKSNDPLSTAVNTKDNESSHYGSGSKKKKRNDPNIEPFS